jgi:catechol 2,3-dioxygenase-like lactoylglutathione lyase family enzyme
MIDHIGIKVSDLARSRVFYQKALAAVGYDVRMEAHGAIGFGPADAKPILWLHEAPTTGVHICLRTAARETVQAFYAAAIAAGGKDNGPPGVRDRYHPSYYAAFVLDPDGNNLETMTTSD